MTSRKPYNFHTQKDIGARGEAFLDRYFRRRYEIVPASEADQRRDIDRWYIHRQSGHRFPVEYKTDAIAGHSGHAFVETESNHERQTPGWALMSEAEYLLYYIPDPEIIYILRFTDLRKKLPLWETLFRKAPVQNEKYITMGLLVPLEDFEQCAIWPRKVRFDASKARQFGSERSES